MTKNEIFKFAKNFKETDIQTSKQMFSYLNDLLKNNDTIELFAEIIIELNNIALSNNIFHKKLFILIENVYFMNKNYFKKFKTIKNNSFFILYSIFMLKITILNIMKNLL